MNNPALVFPDFRPRRARCSTPLGDFVTLPEMNLPPRVKVGLLVVVSIKNGSPTFQFEDCRIDPLPAGPP